MPKLLAYKFDERGEIKMTCVTREGGHFHRLEKKINYIGSDIALYVYMNTETKIGRRNYPYEIDCKTHVLRFDESRIRALGQGDLHYAAIEEKETGHMVAFQGQIGKDSFYMGYHAYTLPENEDDAIASLERMEKIMEDFVIDFNTAYQQKT